MTQSARRNFLPGHVVVIICSITIQLFNFVRTYQLQQHRWYYNKIASFFAYGILFLSYPLLGYIADVCLTRYRTLTYSFIFLIVGCTIRLIVFLVTLPVSLTEMLEQRSLFNKDKNYVHTALVVSAIPLIALITTGVGLKPFNLDWINY